MGVGLIAASFAIYPIYALIAFLPLPASVRVATAIVASIASWAVFFVGSILSGRPGIEYVKSWFTQSVRSLPPPVPPVPPDEPADGSR
jgi:hypothetical protein